MLEEFDTNKPEIKTRPFVAVASAFLGILTYFVVYIVLSLVLGIIFTFLLNIPILSTLINFLFRIRRDSPDWVILFVSLMTAYYLVKTLMFKINRSKKDRAVSCSITGSAVLIFGLFGFIMNIVFGADLFIHYIINIGYVISGAVLIYTGSQDDER